MDRRACIIFLLGVVILVVQQTFGGVLNFVPHLHVLVSAGGLREAQNFWVHRLHFDERELMLAWRYGLIFLLSEALKRNALKSSVPREKLISMLATQSKRAWNIYISRYGSKAYRLKHDGRYIRRPPVAQPRLRRRGEHEVEYLAKDTRTKQFVQQRYAISEFVSILMQHVPQHGQHAMRYFGLLAPRSKPRTWPAVFLLLNQKQRAHPVRLSWRWLRKMLRRRSTLGQLRQTHALGRPQRSGCCPVVNP